MQALGTSGREIALEPIYYSHLLPPIATIDYRVSQLDELLSHRALVDVQVDMSSAMTADIGRQQIWPAADYDDYAMLRI